MRTTSIISEFGSECGDGSREPQRRLVTIHHSPLKGDLDLLANGEDVRVVLKPVTGGHHTTKITGPAPGDAEAKTATGAVI